MLFENQWKNEFWKWEEKKWIKCLDCFGMEVWWQTPRCITKCDREAHSYANDKRAVIRFLWFSTKLLKRRWKTETSGEKEIKVYQTQFRLKTSISDNGRIVCSQTQWYRKKSVSFIITKTKYLIIDYQWLTYEWFHSGVAINVNCSSFYATLRRDKN